ncbi:MAG: SAP domain-containing protein [Coprobacillus sp.]
MERPLFKDIKTFDEFIKYYWYKEELQGICKEYGLDHIGNKQELSHFIEEYFKGNIIKPQKRISVKKKDIELTLDTKLLESGFAMRNEYREFFGKQVGVTNFKFTANMAAAIKKVRQTKDKDFTVRDLIGVYFGTNDYAVFDSSACQWNQFAKDFCNDERNSVYRDKFKVAAIIWKQLRLSTVQKVYNYDFVVKNQDLIKEYEKQDS